MQYYYVQLDGFVAINFEREKTWTARWRKNDVCTYQSVPDGHQFVTDNEATVHLSCSTVHNFGHVDAIVARYMLIADTAGDAEAEALVTLDQLDLNQLRVPPSAYVLKIDRGEET